MRNARDQGNLFGEGLACRYLALMRANANPDDPEVNDHMRRSRDVLLEGGCELEAARTLVAWGQLGLRRGDPDARDRLNRAIRTFQDAGLPWEVEYVSGLLRQ
jgi:hypothetical protein